MAREGAKASFLATRRSGALYPPATHVIYPPNLISQDFFFSYVANPWVVQMENRKRSCEPNRILCVKLLFFFFLVPARNVFARGIMTLSNTVHLSPANLLAVWADAINCYWRVNFSRRGLRESILYTSARCWEDIGWHPHSSRKSPSPAVPSWLLPAIPPLFPSQTPRPVGNCSDMAQFSLICFRVCFSGNLNASGGSFRHPRIGTAWACAGGRWH